MRIFKVEDLIEPIKNMCIQACRVLPDDVWEKLEELREKETSAASASALDDIIKNYEIARESQMPSCQDTGMALVFIDQGRDVFFEGNLEDAVQEGVRQGYLEGYLRKSIVSDPLRRVNTGTNTPTAVYLRLVDGDKVTVTVAPKGFGSENMGRLQMLKPADGEDGVKDFVLETVKLAGPNPCPPIIVGVGIGGNFDKVALAAKRSLLRKTGEHNPDPYYAEMEKELLEKINKIGIGAQGYGGRSTAMAVHIEALPTHIAGLPVAVNIQCHAARHVTEVL